MPVAGGGFEQCYNAQAAVAAGSLLVVAADVTQAPNDKQQVEPMLDKLGALPGAFGKPENLLADAGYHSEGNVAALRESGDRAADRRGPPAASSPAEPPLRGAAAGARKPDAGRSRSCQDNGPPAEDA